MTDLKLLEKGWVTFKRDITAKLHVDFKSTPSASFFVYSQINAKGRGINQLKGRFSYPNGQLIFVKFKELGC